MVVSMVKPTQQVYPSVLLKRVCTQYDPRIYVGIPNFGPFQGASKNHKASTLKGRANKQTNTMSNVQELCLLVLNN